jgi:hypothetical protein
MRTNHVNTRDPEPGLVTKLLRSRLGNVLLVCNLLFMVRAELRTYWYFTFGDEYGYRFPFAIRSFGESPLFMLFHLAHLPTWAVVWAAEWLIAPFVTGVDYATRAAAETALFVVLASLQWLVVGHVVERWRAARLPAFDPRGPLALGRPADTGVPRLLSAAAPSFAWSTPEPAWTRRPVRPARAVRRRSASR